MFLFTFVPNHISFDTLFLIIFDSCSFNLKTTLIYLQTAAFKLF
jgi:hypothetical protein